MARSAVETAVIDHRLTVLKVHMAVRAVHLAGPAAEAGQRLLEYLFEKSSEVLVIVLRQRDIQKLPVLFDLENVLFSPAREELPGSDLRTERPVSV